MISQKEKKIWICKPADSSRGRKIFLIRDLSELTYDEQYVIQRVRKGGNVEYINDFDFDFDFV